MTEGNGQLVHDPGAYDDNAWFTEHPTRITRIRTPFPGEYGPEFISLGLHDQKRRRILTWRMMAVGDNVLGRVPFLATTDETIENEDAILVPILDDMMKSAGRRQMN